MSNIASALKEEISRLSRREVRHETDGLKKLSAQYRSEIATLKRRVTALEKQLKEFGRAVSKDKPTSPTPTEGKSVRYSAKRFQAQRMRLGLSAADAGVLLNVSQQTIYNWEMAKSRPRPEHLPAIVAMRKLSPRDARAILTHHGQ